MKVGLVLALATASVAVGAGPAQAPAPSDQAAVRWHWGQPVPSRSDEYDGAAVDLTKWGLFGAKAGQADGCSAGYHGPGRRCAGQTTVGGALLSVTGTAGGVTGGLYSVGRPFRYGRVEVRERAVPLAANGGQAYHAVPLLWPEHEEDYESAEIDFAERDVGAPAVQLFVHHGQATSCSFTVDSAQFHNYAVDWQPGSVRWYVDGDLVCTVAAAIDSFSVSNGGAQLDMFPADGTLMRPAREDVDWVRMYAGPLTELR